MKSFNHYHYSSVVMFNPHDHRMKSRHTLSSHKLLTILTPMPISAARETRFPSVPVDDIPSQKRECRQGQCDGEIGLQSARLDVTGAVVVGDDVCAHECLDRVS